MTRRRKFSPLNIPTSTPTLDQIGRKFERRGFETVHGSAELVSDAYVRYERQGWMTDYALSDTGDESQAWTYYSAGDGWLVYVLDTRSWTLNETALMYGLRWDANVPSADGDSWAGGQVSAQDYRPYAVAGNDAYGAAMYPTCVSQHMNRQRINAVQFPVRTDASHTLQTRLRYYRLLHDLTPVTDILEACDEDDWSSAWTGASSGFTAQIYSGVNWTLTKRSPYRFTRGVRLGLDAWIEFRAATAGSHTIEIYAAGPHTSFTAPAARWSHGFFGVSTGANAGFRPASQTYTLTMTGGTWRPYQTSPSDEFTWLTASGHTITTSKCETLAANASRDYLLLDWAREIPLLKVILGGGRTADSVSTFYYVPEDASGYVQRWTNTQIGPTTYYFYAQSPGGAWNHKGSTTFVPLFGVQSDTVDSFTDQTVTARPTSITVTRAQQ